MSLDLAAAYAVIGENVDTLVTLDFRPRGYSHGVIHNLYRAAREDCGESLTMAAAKRLVGAVSPGDVVFITTGAGNPLYLPKGETDGPLGAAALAKIVSEGLGATPILLIEEPFIEPLAASLVAAGLGLREPDVARGIAGTSAIIAFPADLNAAETRSTELLDAFGPSAVIATEKLGPNAAGVIHSATGMALSGEIARVDRLVEQAKLRGVLTIGIGDNGNEIGCGRIRAAVREFKPFGRVCQCPCGQGLATETATDVLVIAGTSNWGAYGVEACLSALLGRPELIHSPEVEAFMLAECVRSGGVDGSTARQELGVDGTSLEVQQSIVRLLRSIVVHGLAEPRSRPF